MEERPDHLSTEHLGALGLLGGQYHGDAVLRVEHLVRVRVRGRGRVRVRVRVRAAPRRAPQLHS